MDKAHVQAQATRERNAAIRAARMEEQAAVMQSARQALKRVIASPDATPSEVLEAVKLLEKFTL